VNTFAADWTVTTADPFRLRYDSVWLNNESKNTCSSNALFAMATADSFRGVLQGSLLSILIAPNIQEAIKGFFKQSISN
jgi:hypothetical protein